MCQSLKSCLPCTLVRLYSITSCPTSTAASSALHARAMGAQLATIMLQSVHQIADAKQRKDSQSMRRQLAQSMHSILQSIAVSIDSPLVAAQVSLLQSCVECLSQLIELQSQTKTQSLKLFESTALTLLFESAMMQLTSIASLCLSNDAFRQIETSPYGAMTSASACMKALIDLCYNVVIDKNVKLHSQHACSFITALVRLLQRSVDDAEDNDEEDAEVDDELVQHSSVRGCAHSTLVTLQRCKRKIRRRCKTNLQ